MAVNLVFHIAERERAEALLTDAQQLAGLGSWEYDIETACAKWSDTMFSILGRPIELGPLTPTDSLVMIHPDDRPEAINQYKRSLEIGTTYIAERRVVCNDGREIWIHAHTMVDLVDDRPRRIYGTIMDITDRKAAEQRIEEYCVAVAYQVQELATSNKMLEALSTTDGLTGLSNHRAFQERIRDEFQIARRYASPLSMIMIDVDRFKQYNDDFGHPAGDDVLKAVAQVITDCTRDVDMSRTVWRRRVRRHIAAHRCRRRCGRCRTYPRVH